MKNKLINFFNGRYGSDDFGMFLVLIGFIVLITGWLIGKTTGLVTYCVAVVIMGYCCFRTFSRNFEKRRNENAKFLIIRNKIFNPIKRQINIQKQKKSYCFFKCKQCKTTVRVPKGKGKIKITCPKCGNTFMEDT